MTSRIAGTRRIVASLLAMALGAWAAAGPVAASAGGTAAAARKLTWRLRLATQYLPPSTNHSQYNAVLVVSGVAWFFGGSDVGGHGVPEVEHLRHDIPSTVALPSGAKGWISAVGASSAANIWAATALSGLVLRWNGHRWSSVPRGGWKAGTRFSGITAISPSNVWLFGASAHGHQGAGTWHWTGTGWTRVRGAAGGIIEASTAKPGDTWAIGAAGGVNRALLQLHGATWHRVRPAAVAGMRFARIAAIAPDDVWVTGSVSGRPELGHYNGARWALVHMPGPVPATGLCRDGAGGIWVIANSGTGPSVMLHRSAAGRWTTVTVSSNPANRVLACGVGRGTTADWGAGVSAAPHGTAAAAYRYS